MSVCPRRSEGVYVEYQIEIQGSHESVCQGLQADRLKRGGQEGQHVKIGGKNDGSEKDGGQEGPGSEKRDGSQGQVQKSPCGQESGNQEESGDEEEGTPLSLERFKICVGLNNPQDISHLLPRTVNILIKNMLDALIGGMSYWAVGWAFAYGAGGNGFIGLSNFFSIGMESYILCKSNRRPTFFGLWGRGSIKSFAMLYVIYFTFLCLYVYVLYK